MSLTTESLWVLIQRKKKQTLPVFVCVKLLIMSSMPQCSGVAREECHMRAGRVQLLLLGSKAGA